MRHTNKAPVGFIKKPQAAEFMGCKIRTIDNWMRSGKIPFYKVGRMIYFKESDLTEAVLKTKTIKTPCN